MNRVSVHGGHSGEFGDGLDTLEEIVQEYIRQGFEWVGITEHAPPLSDAYLFRGDIEAGFSAEKAMTRFTRYMDVCRELQRRYDEEIDLYVGFETEYYPGYEPFLTQLLEDFTPDYIVGSLHHVREIPIDVDRERYGEALAAAGGAAELYCRYFDRQLDLIARFRPAVVGHFDLIRIFEASRDLDLILDYNVRAYDKGMAEPYVSRPILDKALELGIAVVPGDDSHGVAGVGRNIDRGIELLARAGFDTDWRRPARARHA
jgi:histidinol-phosphatase (PHP family)